MRVYVFRGDELLICGWEIPDTEANIIRPVGNSVTTIAYLGSRNRANTYELFENLIYRYCIELFEYMHIHDRGQRVIVWRVQTVDWPQIIVMSWLNYYSGRGRRGTMLQDVNTTHFGKIPPPKKKLYFEHLKTSELTKKHPVKF